MLDACNVPAEIREKCYGLTIARLVGIKRRKEVIFYRNFMISS
jgi:hypothetical protein